MIKILSTPQEDEAERRAKASTTKDLWEAFNSQVMADHLDQIWFYAVYHELKERREIPKKMTPAQEKAYKERLMQYVKGGRNH